MERAIDTAVEEVLNNNNVSHSATLHLQQELIRWVKMQGWNIYNSNVKNDIYNKYKQIYNGASDNEEETLLRYCRIIVMVGV